MNKITFEFFGIPIFKWEGWDTLDYEEICYYDVDFLLPELVHLNGRDVSVSSNGKIKLYDEDGKKVIDKYFCEFDSFMEKLIEKYPRK